MVRTLIDWKIFNQASEPKQLPIQISVKGLFDSQKVKGNISNWTIAELGQTAISNNLDGLNIISILTEMQKRVAFSFASFTFALSEFH